jgi:hypothetical protein
MQRLLGSLLEQSEFELIRFENQPSKGGTGVPDAIIQSSIRLLLETKTERNAVSLPQIKRTWGGSILFESLALLGNTYSLKGSLG